MKEFIILIYDDGDPMSAKPEAVQQAHIQKVGQFIADLAQKGQLLNAQPFAPHGNRIVRKETGLGHTTFQAGQGDIAGFYHIKAEDLDTATKIAASDPRFEDSFWTLEVREFQAIAGIN